MLKFTLRRMLSFIDQSLQHWTIDRILPTRRIQLISQSGEITSLMPTDIYRRWRTGEWHIDPDSVVNNHHDVIYTTLARDLKSYSSEEQKQAIARYEYIKPLLDHSIISTNLINRHREAVRLPCSSTQPSVRSVRRWIRCYQSANDITQLIDKKPCRRPVDDPRFYDLFEQALDSVYLSLQRIDRVSAINELCRLIDQHNETVTEDDWIKKPSRATLYRRLQDLDRQIVDRARFGRTESLRMYRTALVSITSLCILDRIEIDHTLVNIILVDKNTGEILGRPWLTIAIDTYSRIIYGFYLSFDAPSSNSVLQCLLRGVLPKEDIYQKYPDLINPWPAHGFATTVVFDNGLDAHAARVLDALKELGVAFVQYCPSKTPWYKGTVERFFRTLNCLIHTLPGTTFSNPKQRSSYPSEAMASMGLEELEHAIVKWIVDVYQIRTHRTTKMPPLERWNRNAVGRDIYLPSSKGELELLLGIARSRRLFHYGIEYDCMKYNSRELQDLYHRLAKHTDSNRSGVTVEFKCYDTTVEYIDVLDPQAKEYLRVPAVDMEYAKNLARHTHYLIRRALRKEFGDEWRRDDQMKAQQDIKQMLESNKYSKRRAQKLAASSAAQSKSNLPAAINSNSIRNDNDDSLPDFSVSMLAGAAIKEDRP